MKYLDHHHEKTLFLELSECVLAGISEKTIETAKLRNSDSWLLIKDPSDKRKTLVGYEKLSPKNKDLIQAKYGDPYGYVVKAPILGMLKDNTEANRFYLEYRCNGASLPLKRVKQYTRAAQWLDLVNAAKDKTSKIIKSLSIKTPVFFDFVAELMQIEKKNGQDENYNGPAQLPGDFPTSYQNLLRKSDSYKDLGYAMLIDKMYGNKKAAKINDEVAEAQLLELIANPMQYDDVLITMMYNVWASKNNYKMIEPPTVGVWRRKKEAEVTLSRYGNAAFNEKYIRQVKGLLPSHPLALVEHDDNNLDFLFSDAAGYNFNKYVAICVIDSRTKLLLGKSYFPAQNPQQWQVQHAYLDAMYYIRSIVNDGNWYKPFELKADKWALKSLTPSYEKYASHFITPSHGNKHRGYIEQFFASPLWKRAQQLVSLNNWSGNNMTAKFRGVNEENLRLHANHRPLIGNEAEQQIENFFHLLRHMPDMKRMDMNAPSKEEQFMQEWNQLSIEEKQPINDEQFLLNYGIKHSPQGRTISITNRGVEPQIKNSKLSYDLPEQWMYNKYPGAKVNVYYDPFDMSRVLITNEDDIRFIARTAMLAPRALKDQYTSSRTFLNAILDDKKDQVRKVSDASAARKQLVNTDYYNAEAMLQGGVLVKEMKNAAEQQYLETGGRRTMEDMINDM